MAKLTNKKAITKLRALQKYLLDEPKRFNLDAWGIHIDPKNTKQQLLRSDIFYEGDINFVKKQNPPCGTVACLAGNLCVMGKIIGPKDFKNELVFEFDTDTPELAANYLGLTEQEAQPLFYLKGWSGYENGWPDEFATRLKKHNPGTKEYAKVAVARIEHFINTGE